MHIAKGAEGATTSVICDALLLNKESKSETYPYMEINEEKSTISHEAKVGKVGENQLFYLMSRGLTEGEALAMIVNGFISEFTRELPMEYAIEVVRLIQLEMENMEGRVG